jgi:hypothetical protein
MTIYLYIKQHISTGLKYFGKTIKNPYTYKGSGRYWRSHLRKHGFDVETVQVWEFDDSELCMQFALEFSRDNNIVLSSEWANLREENGSDGNLPGTIITQEQKVKMSKAKLGKKRTFSKSHCANISKARKGVTSSWKGRKHSAETKAKISAIQLGKKRGPYKKKD